MAAIHKICAARPMGMELDKSRREIFSLYIKACRIGKHRDFFTKADPLDAVIFNNNVPIPDTVFQNKIGIMQ